ncbi:hypothetical protein GMSM_34830 [Geomonas sp. Red276]
MYRIVGLFAAVLMLVASTAYAGPGRGWQGSGGWGMQGAFGRLYNPATVETVAGKVTVVNRIAPMRGMGAGVHIDVDTGKETVSVHLGPAWFIDRQDTRIEKGDQVEVKGSRVTIAGKPAIIAAQVTKGDQLLKLRDDNGVPVWSGWRRGQ